jgi:hypothetical protein
MMNKRVLFLTILLVLTAAAALASNILNQTALSTVAIPDPINSTTQNLGTKGSYTMTTGADITRVDWSCDANDSPTFTAVPVKVQLATFTRYSSNGEPIYTTQPTFRHAATGAIGIHPLTKKAVFTKLTSATKATCRFWVN